MSEHEEQVALVNWARTMAGGMWPELRLLFAVPNGGLRPSRVNARGQRYSPSAQRYRVEVCRGWEAARDVLVEYLGAGVEAARADRV